MKSKINRLTEPQKNKKSYKNAIDMKSMNTRILVCFLIFVVVIFVVFWVAMALIVRFSLEPALKNIDGEMYITVKGTVITMFWVSIGALVLCTFLSLLLSYILSKPMYKLSIAAKRVAEGEKDVNFKIKGYTEVQELAESLTFMSQQMIQADSLKRDLMANVSHDLRTPLTIIKAYAEMIKDVSGENKEKREQHCSIIVSEADRLTNLVQDILDLSKIEVSGAQIMSMSDVNMSELTSNVVEKFLYLVEQEQYIIETDIEDGLMVYGDEKRLEQVVYNLIANAINYTGDDHKIAVKLYQTPKKKVRFEVKDTGKGISEEDKIKVWQRYYRTSSSAKRQTKGTGLGLSIVKTILEAHRAKCGIDSVIGKGSTFYFEL